MRHFTWKELTRTTSKLPNIPNSIQKANIEYLINNLIDPLQDRFKFKIKVNSCFRSPAVNTAVGGANSSQHMANNGAAIDITCQNNLLLFKTIELGYNFDQLIWEFGSSKSPQWIHVSLKKFGNRKQVLRAIKKNGKTVYEPFEDM